MLEPKEEVKQTVDPSPTEEVVSEPANDPQEPATETPETTEPQPSEAGQPQVEALDENGVPYKNRYFEYKRKNEELAEKLPTLVEEAISKSMGQHQQQPQYTEEQLEAFAEQTENPAYKTWAKGEIRKLQEDRTAKLIRGEFEKVQRSQQEVAIKKDSLNYVMRTYPEAFQRDASGNPLGWNQRHPLTQIIGELMKNPDLKNRPDALMIASDIAYGRYARSQGAAGMKKERELKREVKNLQKRTLVEGGGKDTVSSVPAHRAAIEKLAETGSLKDAQKAIGEILKAKRASEE